MNRDASNSLRSTGSLAATIVLISGVLAGASEMVLDSGDVRDWAWVRTSGNFKHRDTVLTTTALISFSLEDLPDDAKVSAATLRMYYERSDTGARVAVEHVTDDSWGFVMTAPSSLYDWPVAHTISRYWTGTAGWREIDVTAHVQEELKTRSEIFSLKIRDVDHMYPDHRIASPSHFRYEWRPNIRMTISSAMSQLLPDATLGPSDIEPSDPVPFPGRQIDIDVTIRNLGTLPARDIGVRLYDGDPSSGGTPIDGIQSIEAISPAGGQSRTTFRWTARAGDHRLWAVVDPQGRIAETDEANNSSFHEVTVLDRYDEYTEDFELRGVIGSGTMFWGQTMEGVGPWTADAEVPSDSNTGLCRQWSVLPLRGTPCRSCVALGLDGRSDNGAVWIERWVPVSTESTVAVDLSFACDGASELSTIPVYYIGVLDPEMESDLTMLPPQTGWHTYEVQRTVRTGRHSRLWIAVGLAAVWETYVAVALDDIRIQLRMIADPSGAPLHASPRGQGSGTNPPDLFP